MSITITRDGQSETYLCPLCDDTQHVPNRSINAAALCDDHATQLFKESTPEAS